MIKIYFPIKDFKSTQKGFTLVELLLYIAISSVVLLSTSLFLSLLLGSNIKNQTIAEVEQQGMQTMSMIAQTIRNSENITSPTVGSSDTSLTLDVINVSNDPTVFDISSGSIQITEGAGSAVPLTNERVTASNISFENLSYTGTNGTIQIEFTLTYINSSGRNEYDFSKTFTSSASLR